MKSTCARDLQATAGTVLLLTVRWILPCAVVGGLWFVSCVGGRGDRPETLGEAAEKGDIVTVRRMLKGGTAADAADPVTKTTPLMYASRFAREEVVQLLLAS